MHYRKSFGEKLFDTGNYLLLTFLMIACLYPFYYIFIYSISDPQAASKGIALVPSDLTIDNYIRIFHLENILNAAAVSVARTVAGTVLTVLCCSLFSYFLSKKELYMKTAIYRFVIITMYFNAGLIPWYLTMKFFGLRNSFLAYIIPNAVNAFYVILFKTFIEQLSPSLEESAMIDGAGYLKIFKSIIFPLSRPIIATIAVFTSVTQWNSWTDNMFLVSDPRLQTLQYMLYNYLNEAQALANKSMQDLNRADFKSVITPESIKMTITMVATLPILFVYPYLQKHFVKGIMLGAVKG